VTSLSGVSGAGRNLKPEYLFVECNESVRAYGVPRHRHLAEIEQELSGAFGGAVSISFAPHLIPVTRGIHTTIHTMPGSGVTPSQIDSALDSAYAQEPFVRLLGTAGSPDTRNVAHTNFLDLAWRHDSRTGRLVLLSAEDNLIKGAAGQAVQCLNVMGGWPEPTGLL
jgi:N-acetyl-gamma-glutamyl-phosphate reductase